MTEPWELRGVRPGSAGYLPIVTHTYRLPDGTEADWDIFGGGRSVAVLAITRSDDVVLVRQFRPGPGEILAELPGGNIEDGEEVLAAAARELLEETGYSGDMELAGTSWLASASRTQRFVAVARNARRVADLSPEAGEFCEVTVVSLGEFRAHLRSGQLTDVDLGYLALDHLGLLGPAPSSESAAIARYVGGYPPESASRSGFDLDLYEQRVLSAPCFICAIVNGDVNVPTELVWRNDRYIAFLAEFPQGERRGVVMRGHVLLAPVDHREDIVGDFGLDEFLEIQTLVYKLGRAITSVTPTERLYVLSLGSKHGNAHVHWHVAPLPPGTPYRSQQFASLMPETAGLLELDRTELGALATRIGDALRRDL